ncbi:hypothetical protein BDB01DRAFT_108497 [Pilobolus umbonatus]|nr:hypothetical protein BDB01DRAFT_108497 [Pilobolus umbonatus]
MELNKKTSLTSFNFQSAEDIHNEEGVLSKIFDRVIHVVSGPIHDTTPIYTPTHSIYSERRHSTASSSAAHYSLAPSIHSTHSLHLEEEYTMKNHITEVNPNYPVSLNLETVPRSSTSTTATNTTNITVASQKSGIHDDFNTNTTVQFIMPPLRRSMDDNHTSLDYLLHTPLSKRQSIDSDTQSIATNFSISNSNSLSRIIARLRGQKSDKEFWMPDEQCKECYKCRKPFTLLRRKHHCRTCGQIFCGKCASHIISGKLYKQKGQVRVCNFCYAEQQNKNDNTDQHYKPDPVPNSPLSKHITLPNTENTYAPVIPSQRPPIAAPQMQIPSAALKHARSTYGNNDTTTVALEIPTHASDSYLTASPQSMMDPKLLLTRPSPSTSNLVTLTSRSNDCSLNTTTSVNKSLHGKESPTLSHATLSSPTIDTGGLKRLFDAGTSLLKSRPRSNTSSSAPLEDTRLAVTQSTPLRTQHSGYLDRGGGTVLAESQLSPYSNTVDDNDESEYQPRNTKPSEVSPSTSKIELASSDDDDHRLRLKKELRGTRRPYRFKIKSPEDPCRQRRISGPPPTVELSLSARNHARTILRQLMADIEMDAPTKEEWEDVIMNLLLKVANHVQPDIRAGDDMDVRHYVKIKKIPGGLPSDSFYVKGVICTKNVAHKRMIKNLSNPRILILLFSLDYSRVEMENQLLSIAPVIYQEKEHISKLVGRIIALRPSLLIVKSTVSRLALEILLEAGIPVIHNVKRSVIEAIARCTEAAIVTSVDKLQQGLSFGRCGSFEIRTVMHEWIPNRRKTYLIFDDCTAELGGTIVLRGDRQQTLSTIKRIVDFMVFVVHNLKLETSLLRDSFAKNRGSSETHVVEKSPSHPDDDEEEHNDLAELIRKYQQTILSVSQYVNFPPPYLLIACKEIEDKLAMFTQKRKSLSNTFIANTKELVPLSPSPTRSTFEKHQTEAASIHNSVKMLADNWLDDEYDLISRYHHISRAWDVYRGENPESVSPYYHQNIVVLYSNVCTVTTVPCQGPEIRIFGYYRFPSDKTLGQYIVDLCTDARQPCSSFMCDHPMLQHYRSYAHGSARVDVMIESFPCPMPGMSDKLLMWNYCKECNKPTPVLPMSENTWNYSFGKFLEIFLYQRGVHCRADICPHDMIRNHVRYFGYMDMAVRFQYDPIELLEVSPPPMKLYISIQVQRDLKETEMKSLRSKINKFYQSIIERNKAFPFDLVDPRKLEACKAELQEMSYEAQREKKDALQLVQNVFANSHPNDTLTINSVRRNLFQVVNHWDHVYTDFVRFYLEPERELKKITATHLRKMFPADDTAVFTMDNERTKRAAEVTDLPLLGFDLDDDDEDTDKRKIRSTKKKMILPELSSTPTLMYSPELSDSSFATPPKSLRNDTKSFLRPEIRRKLSLQLLHELKDRANAQPNNSKPIPFSRRNGSTNLSATFTPSRIPVPHFYTHSKAQSPTSFEHDELKYRRSNAFSQKGPPHFVKRFYLHHHTAPTAQPKSTSDEESEPVSTEYLRKSILSKDKRFRSRLPRKKTYIQMYTEANDLVQEDIDDEFYPGGHLDDSQSTVSKYDHQRVRHNYGYMTFNKGPFRRRMDTDDSEDDLIFDEDIRHPTEPTVDYFSPLAPYASEVIEQASDSAEEEERYDLISASDLLMAQQVIDDISLDHPVLSNVPPIRDESRHANEKSSFMKTLTNFLTDSGVANLLPLESPLQSTEYLFPDSYVIVREDEPSTIIAYTLSSEDYLEKMHDIQDYCSDGDEGTVYNRAPSESHTLENGFQTSIHNTEEIQETLLRESGTHMRYNFSTGNTKFFCKIFFAEQFDALRRNCGCDDSYIMSLASCVPWDNAGGKSGSAFLKTKDDRLLMKQMSKYELDAFLRFAPAYFQYMSEAFFSELPTVLAKIFGFYSIGYKNSTTGKSMRMDVLVMENLFYQRKITKIFDLKGSMRNRHVQSTGKQDEVLLDENLVELIYHSPLFIRAHSKEILRSSLHNDALFLSNRNVMDYSLLVGIDEERQELVVGIVDFIRTFTWDKKLESWVKESGILGGGGKGPTIVSPRQYRIRFREAMERYFLMVPDKFALIRQTSKITHIPMHHHNMSEISYDE